MGKGLVSKESILITLCLCHQEGEDIANDEHLHNVGIPLPVVVLPTHTGILCRRQEQQDDECKIGCAVVDILDERILIEPQKQHQVRGAK